MILRLKLLALIAWNKLTSGDIIQRIELKQRLSTAAFEEAAQSLNKVENLYKQQSDRFEQEAAELEQAARARQAQADDAHEHARQLGAKLDRLQEFLL